MRWLKKSSPFLRQAPLEELQGEYVSPGRGWYHIYTFQPDRQDEEQLKWLPLEENETLVLLRLDIGAFRNREIDEQTLFFIERIFVRFAEADKEMILRVTYDTEGKGMAHEPARISQVCSHMRSIGRLVAKHAEKFLLAQGLFVGSWGEMHDSKFLQPEQIRMMWEQWNEATEGKVALAVRRPAYARMILGQKSQEGSSGLYDDAFLADETHMGTFGTRRRAECGWEDSWCARDEYAYMKSVMNQVPAGGEALPGQKSLSVKEILQELRTMQITYLNSIYHPDVMEDWRQKMLPGGSGLYEEIANHMGYRFVVRSVSCTGKHLSITIENNGFAPLYDKTELYVIRVGIEQDEKRCVLPANLCEIQPGEKMVFCVDNPFPSDAGCGYRWFLKAIRIRDHKVIRFANEGAEDKLLIGRME